ncbi:TlpA family protein disulfide reductase [bacterium]|nr:TlpA family protein disulfide reductase [bacterium]
MSFAGSVWAYRALSLPLHGDTVALFSETVQREDGTKARMLQRHARITILYWWASWCPYCADEFQQLQKVKKRYGSAVEVIALNRGESLEVIHSFTAPFRSNGIVFLNDADDSVFKKIGGYAMPETLFISRKGQIIAHQHGPSGEGELEALVERELR